MITSSLFARFFEQGICGQLDLFSGFDFTVESCFSAARRFGTFCTQFFDQRFTISAKARIICSGVVNASLFGSAINDGVEFALRSQAQRYGILWLDFSNIPMASQAQDPRLP